MAVEERLYPQRKIDHILFSGANEHQLNPVKEVVTGLRGVLDRDVVEVLAPYNGDRAIYGWVDEGIVGGYDFQISFHLNDIANGTAADVTGFKLCNALGKQDSALLPTGYATTNPFLHDEMLTLDFKILHNDYPSAGVGVEHVVGAFTVKEFPWTFEKGGLFGTATCRAGEAPSFAAV